MDFLKQEEQVLRFLIDLCKEKGESRFLDTDTLYKQFESMPFFEDVLSSLDEKGYIKAFSADQYFAYKISVLPAGLKYFEDKKIRKKEKWENRRWNIIQACITSVLGFFIGYILGAVVKWLPW